MNETIKKLHEVADFNFEIAKLEGAGLTLIGLGIVFWYCFWKKDKGDK